MTDETQIPEAPKTDRMAAARAAKAAKRESQKEQMVPVSVVLDLQRRLAEMEAAMKTQPVMTIPAAPEPSDQNRPGSYVKVYEDKQGNAMYSKVKWSRGWIDKTYPSVTFTPNESLVVLPHGVRYNLVGGQEVTVPSIVKKSYDDTIRTRDNVNRAYRPMNIIERSDVDQRALDNPGTKQWSRVQRLATYGIKVSDNEEEGTEPQAS